jgi:hypothetical protein
LPNAHNNLEYTGKYKDITKRGCMSLVLIPGAATLEIRSAFAVFIGLLYLKIVLNLRRYVINVKE